MAFDTEGYLYVATELGVQVCDQPGRVMAIINQPQTKWLSNVFFGGPNMQWLYVTGEDKVYRRKIQRQGAVPWNPVKPPMPRL
jgi:sugar lactone lactonase YvrE